MLQRLKLSFNKYFFAGVALASLGAGIAAGAHRWIPSESLRRVSSQEVLDTPEHKTLAKSHYDTSVDIGFVSFYSGWLGCLFVFGGGMTVVLGASPKYKRQLGQLLIKQADHQDLVADIFQAVKEVSADDGTS